MKKLIFLFIISIGFVSCEDLLKEEPKMIATGTFYTDPAEIEAGLIGIYHQLNRGFRKNWLCVPEAQVDYGYARGSYLVVNQFQGFNTTNINRMSDIWIRIYRALRDVNLVIQYAPKSEIATSEQIDQFVAEAKFMRAFCYYQLVTYWGAVPLRTEENMTEQAVPREPVENIYDFIVADLTFAEEKLPDNQNQTGRPVKMAAKTLLTEVYLSMQEWASARSKALEVISSGKYALVQVSNPDDFYQIFGPDANGSSEEIFFLKYNQELGSEYAVMVVHPSTPYLNGRGYYGLYTDGEKNKVIKEWDSNDLRKAFNLHQINLLGSSTTMLYKKFIDPESLNRTEAADDNPFYRYADLLLFYAEADCRANSGPTADGIEKLNMVLRRAYGLNPGNPSEIDYKASDYSEDEFIDLILKERGYEHLYEGKRFKDLVRTGKYAQRIKEVHGIDIDSKILKYPIPLDEIQYNEAINEEDQNPGY